MALLYKLFSSSHPSPGGSGAAHVVLANSQVCRSSVSGTEEYLHHRTSVLCVCVHPCTSLQKLKETSKSNGEKRKPPLPCIMTRDLYTHTNLHLSYPSWLLTKTLWLRNMIRSKVSLTLWGNNSIWELSSTHFSWSFLPHSSPAQYCCSEAVPLQVKFQPFSSRLNTKKLQLQCLNKIQG